MSPDSQQQGPCKRCNHPAEFHDKSPGQGRCWKTPDASTEGKVCGCPKYVEPAANSEPPQQAPPYLEVRASIYLVARGRTPDQVEADIVGPLHEALKEVIAQLRPALAMANAEIVVRDIDPVEGLRQLLLNDSMRGVVAEGELFDPDKAARAAPNN